MNITIDLPPVTKKNSSQIIKNPRTGRLMVIPSKQYKQYEKDAVKFLPLMDEPIDYPVEVRCNYYMPTRRKVDLVNLLEATLDVLVKAGVLADDNSGIVMSHDGSRVHYDKAAPRTEIAITSFFKSCRKG